MNAPAAPSPFFSLPRFVRLARVQWAERWRGWAGFALAGALLYALLLALAVGNNHSHNALQTSGQAELYAAGLLLSGPVFAGLYFQGLRQPGAALLLLMRPASVFEKWLLAALTLLLAYPLAYTLVIGALNGLGAALEYQLAVAHFQSLSEAQRGSLAMPRPQQWALFHPLRMASHPDRAGLYDAVADRLGIALMFAGLCGFAVLGSLWFRRAPAIKTVLLGLALFMVTGLLDAVGDGVQLSRLELAQLLPGSLQAQQASALQQLVVALFWLGTPALLWLAAWRALHERELA